MYPVCEGRRGKKTELPFEKTQFEGGVFRVGRVLSLPKTAPLSRGTGVAPHIRISSLTLPKMALFHAFLSLLLAAVLLSDSTPGELATYAVADKDWSFAPLVATGDSELPAASRVSASPSLSLYQSLLPLTLSLSREQRTPIRVQCLVKQTGYKVLSQDTCCPVMSTTAVLCWAFCETNNL
ncbi:hypothetical protein Cni_G25940 [Canna indica]|uniref:Uncharacterized protein n=1 Tax=Canna indica TaxID=4628 RepID=A0AAQ3QLH9_9LILI|nr:hypothetical protein Cni_G25940 [Canna indica]